MGRTATLCGAKRVNITIETETHRRGVEKAREIRAGSFSEYIAKLINRDLTRKGSAAEGISRHIRRART